MPETLRQFRARHGLAAKEVAAILDYTPSYISHCEHGRRRLSANAWRVLRAAVGERGVRRFVPTG